MMCGELVYSTGQQCMSALRSSVAYSVVRAEGERVDQLARIQLLSRAGDPSGLVELGEAVRHHLGVDAEVAHAALEQERADGVGHGADPDLQAIAVLDLGGDEPPDGGVDVADRRIRQLRRGASSSPSIT